MNFGDVEIVAAKERLIPVADPALRVEPYGTIAPGDLNIFITQGVLEEIIGYSRTRLDREVGGALVGRLFAHRGVKYIEIEAYIRALKAVSLPASLRFGHDAWEEITRAKDRGFPESILVGWHHTHPGYGVFLSSYDEFIQRHFFNLPWMVALVVDPRQEQLGFFQWKGGALSRCGFYFVR